jgi:hypothetical protein
MALAQYFLVVIAIFLTGSRICMAADCGVLSGRIARA